MISPLPFVLSASRRTDIPGCYTSWFMSCISRGYFRVRQPFTGKYRTIYVHPENIHSIVFWSKNYAPFLKARADSILTDKGFSLYFYFTINSENPLLEPNLPSLDKRLRQLEHLVQNHGPDKIAWRFDPICFYEDDQGQTGNNLTDFALIAKLAARLGIRKCVTSFYDPCPKVKTRQNFLFSRQKKVIRMMVPDRAKKIRIIRKMAALIKPWEMNLALCAEKDLFSALCPEQDLFSSEHPEPAPENLVENACIDGRMLQKLYNGYPCLSRDRAQRISSGCRCTQSVDIGSYQDHPCPHNCLFCYARTEMDVQIQQHPHPSYPIK